MPDIVIVAKPLAGGLPLGAILAQGKVRRGIFAGHARLDVWRRPTDLRGGAGVSERSRKRKAACQRPGARRGNSRWPREAGREIRFHPRSARRRPDPRNGSFDRGRATTLPKRSRHGLLINCTHDHILRLLPPFIIRKREVKEFLRKFEKVLASAGKQTTKPATPPAAPTTKDKAATHKQPAAMAASR